MMVQALGLHLTASDCLGSPEAPEDLDHLLPFEDHIVALSSTKIFMIPRDFTPHGSGFEGRLDMS